MYLLQNDLFESSGKLIGLKPDQSRHFEFTVKGRVGD